MANMLFNHVGNYGSLEKIMFLVLYVIKENLHCKLMCLSVNANVSTALVFILSFIIKKFVISMCAF